jgi:tyrosinase
MPNIDRLWEVWDEMPTSTGEPTDPNWVNGPASIGERAFVLPEPGQNLTYTPGDMKNMAALGYNYDDVSRPSAAPQMVARLQRFGMTAAAATPSWPDPNPLNFWARAEACA